MGIKENAHYRILVIDDSSTDRDIFRLLLQKEGYMVETAASGKEGFSILYTKPIDLILCDYYMEGMDGEAFLQNLRKDPKLRHLGVIIITSDESKEIRIKLLRSGANDFTHKGAAYEEIMARVATHLSAKELSSARSVLEFAGTYAHEMSQPLSSLIAIIDLMKKEVGTIKDKEQKKSLSELVEKATEPADRMSRLIEKIRKLEMDKTKHYKI